MSFSPSPSLQEPLSSPTTSRCTDDVLTSSVACARFVDPTRLLVTLALRFHRPRRFLDHPYPQSLGGDRRGPWIETRDGSGNGQGSICEFGASTQY